MNQRVFGIKFKYILFTMFCIENIIYWHFVPLIDREKKLLGINHDQ